MNLIIIGPQGSGKGTHAKKLAAKLNLAHISTGDLLREIAKENSEQSKKVKEMLASGILFPDDFMMEILRERMNKNDAKHGFILDGFPRTIKQAEMLEQITTIDNVLYLNVSDDECVRRLAGRRQCKSCPAIYGNENPSRKKDACDACGGELYVREDDREEVIRKRLELYHNQTEPILDFYKENGVLIEIKIEGIKSPEQVFAEICEALAIE